MSQKSESKKKHIAITGASGYIGSHIARRLKKEGYKVTILGRVPVQGYYFRPWSLTKPTNLEQEKIDVLIHCAYDFSLKKAEQIEQVNINGTKSLLQEATKAGIKKKIVLSSVAAFSQAQSMYGKAKMRIEQIAQEHDAIIIRPGLMFGNKPRSVIRSITKIVRISPIIPIIGDGKQLFRVCHVDDLAALVYEIVKGDKKPKTYVLAANKKTYTFKNVIKRIAEKQHKNVFFFPIPFSVMFFAIKCAEIVRFPIGLRSDSVLGIKYRNNNLDFSQTDQYKIQFREF